MNNLVVQQLSTLPIERCPVEIVERKGLGHPDTICDALAEQLSIALCRFYWERFGLLLHHNVDKALLWGGMARPAFGGGKVIAPSEIFLAGRATREFKGIQVPVEELAVETCREWLQQNFHVLEPQRHVKLHCLIRPGSVDLADLYARASITGIWLANDTSCGVGFAPLSPLEQIVYQVEKHLNSADFKQSYPEIGEDIKIMGIRRGEQISLTVGCAFIARFVHNIDDYGHKKTQLQNLVKEKAREIIPAPIKVEVNTGDDLEHSNVYLTVTGTSAEAGDDGEVGRGNRSNGLITPYRPMTLEAAAGKNPVTHIGKLYNIVANQIAAAIVAEIAEVTTAYCYLVSQIGKPVSEPAIIHLQLHTEEGTPVEKVRPAVEAIARDHLSRIDTLWLGVMAGKFSIY